MQDDTEKTDKTGNPGEAAVPSATGRSTGKEAHGREALRQAEARRERAAKTLRDNLLRRKQQGRARRAGQADETSGLPAAKSDESED